MRWKQRQEKAREQTELINFLFVVPLTWRMKSGINEPILVLLLFLLFSMYVCHQLFQTHLQVNWCVDTHVLPNSWVCVDVYFSWASNHHFLFIFYIAYYHRKRPLNNNDTMYTSFDQIHIIYQLKCLLHTVQQVIY